MVGQGLRLKIGITDLRVGISHDPGVILVGNKWPYYNRNDGIYRSVYHGFLCVFVVTDAMRVGECSVLYQVYGDHCDCFVRILA